MGMVCARSMRTLTNNARQSSNSPSAGFFGCRSGRLSDYFSSQSSRLFDSRAHDEQPQHKDDLAKESDGEIGDMNVGVDIAEYAVDDPS